MSEPITPELENKVLELIADYWDWSWYQLELRLGRLGMPVANLPACIAAFAGEGLLTIEGEDPASRSSRYRLTDAGLARIGRPPRRQVDPSEFNSPEVQVIALELIADHDGEWSFYQLDRGIVRRGHIPHPSLVRALKAEGLIMVEGAPDGNGCYKITDAGLARIGRSRS